MKINKTVELTEEEVHQAIREFVKNSLGFQIDTIEIEIYETGDYDIGTYRQGVKKVICTFP